MHEASLHSLQTDNADLSFPHKPTSLIHELCCGMLSLSLKAKKRKRFPMQCVCATKTKALQEGCFFGALGWVVLRKKTAVDLGHIRFWKRKDMSCSLSVHQSSNSDNYVKQVAAKVAI